MGGAPGKREMMPASTRLRRAVTVSSAVMAAYLASPLAGLVWADDGGLGAGGAAFASNYTLIVAIILAFIFGFGLRDYIHKRSLRARPAKKPAPVPPRT